MMKCAADQWRADGAFQSLAAPLPNMFYIPLLPSLVAGPTAMPALCVPAPHIYLGRIPGPGMLNLLPPPIAPEKGDLKDKKKSDKLENKKSASQKAEQKNNKTTPPLLRPGMNYMFPLEHTSIHIFCNARKVWEDKYAGQPQRFKQYLVDTQKTVKALIEFVMQYHVKGDFEKCKGWACTEVIEAGDGKWKKCTTVDYTSDKAKSTLATMGWTAKRGNSLPPVWVAVHKS